MGSVCFSFVCKHKRKRTTKRGSSTAGTHLEKDVNIWSRWDLVLALSFNRRLPPLGSVLVAPESPPSQLPRGRDGRRVREQAARGGVHDRKRVLQPDHPPDARAQHTSPDPPLDSTTTDLALVLVLALALVLVTLPY